MEQVVYADLLFLINFSMDYLCLYVCARIMRRALKLHRILIASAIGGVYSVLSLFLSLSPFFGLTADGAVCLLMSAIVFSQKGRPFSSTMLCAFLFVGISLMTGGCMTAIFVFLNRLDIPLEGIRSDGFSTYLFAIIAAVAGVITLKSGEVISKRSQVSDCLLTIGLSGESITVTAISDTGNLVKDPLSGRCVVLIDSAALSRLVDPKEFEAFKCGAPQNGTKLKNPRIIPINTASGRSLLCACFPDSLTACVTTRKGKRYSLELDALIAPSEIGGSADGALAVIPSCLLKP